MLADLAKSIVGINLSAIIWNGFGKAASLKVLKFSLFLRRPFVKETTFSSEIIDRGYFEKSTLSAVTAKIYLE